MNFTFTYSSFPTFYTEVFLEDNILVFKNEYGGEGVSTELSEGKIDSFWEMIKLIRLDFWKENYSSCVLDGLQWGVKIDTEFIQKEISGVNEYPDGSCELRMTPIFDKLIDAVEFLIGDPGFYRSL